MIEFDSVTISQGAFQLRDISFRLPSLAYGVLMGRSGTGKTTLIELLCGLRSPTSGRILVDGKEITHLSPAARDIGYVPQDGALFNAMKVRDQIGLGLQLRKYGTREIKNRVDELADLLGIMKLLDRYPAKLSGGERQRVALGRALAFRPTILCLDEPTSALDDRTRDDIHAVIRRIRTHAGATVLHVSHSTYEAKALADQLLVIEAGELREIDQVGDWEAPPTSRSHAIPQPHGQSALPR